MNLTYLELFAGAGGMSLGLETAGWRCVAHAEIEPHARAVLRHHWPDVPLYGDVAELDGSQFRGVTMVTGGSPCQDLSIAGKRAGMTEGSGTRSSLFFEQVRIWNESQAPYILWENVYGAFSSNAGRDFAAVLSALVGGAVPVPADGWVRAGVVAGPTGVAAWRVLDAQYFGVPQRRRRVFVLGVRGGGVDPAEVLSLAESLSGHLATSGEARESVAADAGAGTTGASTQYGDIAGSLTARADGSPCVDRGPNVVYATDARLGAAVTRTGFSTTGSVGYVHDVMPTLPHKTGLGCAGAQMMGVLAFAQNTRDEVRVVPGDKVCALAAQPGMKQTNYVLTYDARRNDEVAIPILEATARQGKSTEGSAGIGNNGDPMFTLTGKQHGVFTYDARGNGDGDVVNTMTGGHQSSISDYTAIVLRNREGKPGGGKGPLLSAERQRTLGTANDQVVFATLNATDAEKWGSNQWVDEGKIVQSSIPRRLTPVECERLMGWPDQHTAHGITEAGKPYALADTARYKLCGNGIASPVTAWIGFQLRHYLTNV
jgi:site-specific DNA-cytosine methylase